MGNEIIAPLEKNKITNSTSGCCGGALVSSADACCQLDEEKKVEGNSGCGCNTSEKKESKTSCC